MPPPFPDAPQRILLVRLSAIGDIVFASGVLPALKARYPEARLTWLAEPVGASLLRENPLVDDIVLWPRAQWREMGKSGRWLDLAKAIRSFREDLRKREFDLAIDLQGLLKSGLLARLSAATYRISLGGLESSHLLAHRTISRQTDDRRIGSEYYGLSLALGCPPDSFRLNLPFSAKTAAKAEALLGQRSRWIVCCPFTTRPQKHWFPEHWRELVNRLQAADTEVEIAVLGAPDNRADAEAWFSGTTRPIHNLCGKTSLLEAAAVIDRAATVIGVDTGLTHMGIARRRPTIALFGSTRPYLTAPGASLKVLYHELPCAPCRRHPTCNGAFTCLWELKPEMVAREALANLADGDSEI